jgi:hypothetical protein
MTVEKLGQLIEFNAQLLAFRTESLSWAASDTAAQMDFVAVGNGEAAVGSLLELARISRVLNFSGTCCSETEAGRVPSDQVVSISYLQCLC